MGGGHEEKSESSTITHILHYHTPIPWQYTSAVNADHVRGPGTAVSLRGSAPTNVTNSSYISQDRSTQKHRILFSKEDSFEVLFATYVKSESRFRTKNSGTFWDDLFLSWLTCDRNSRLAKFQPAIGDCAYRSSRARTLQNKQTENGEVLSNRGRENK